MNLAQKITPLCFGFSLLLSASCLPLTEQPTPRSSLATASPTLQPSPSIVWFPPTSTHTPYPTYQPSLTPETMPGTGVELYAEAFTDPSAWTNVQPLSDGGNNILLSEGRLTLALNQVPARLQSVHTALLLTDFYAETTAHLNRCSGEDAYGILFRAAAENYAYRFLLNCNGQMRVDRLRGGDTYPLVDWLPSGGAPPGAPAQVRLGVWVAGVEMRFFLNGQYQLSLTDTLYPSGSFGYTASALSPVGINVSFDALTIRRVTYLSPTPTPSPSHTPLPSRTPRPTP